jgi:hypothetical protein
MKKIIALLVIGALLSGCATTTNVNIKTNVDGARVIVDGKILGETPVNSVEMKNNAGGSYQVIIEKEGYKTYRGILQKEDKMGAMAAVIVGYSLSFLLLPLLLLLYAPYISGPVPDQYFSLEAAD